MKKPHTLGFINKNGDIRLWCPTCKKHSVFYTSLRSTNALVCIYSTCESNELFSNCNFTGIRGFIEYSLIAKIIADFYHRNKIAPTFIEHISTIKFI